MVRTVFSEFRKHSSTYLNRVENGEVVVILRHGKPIAELTPYTGNSEDPTWKREALRLNIKGLSLSKALLKDRKNTR